MYEGAGEGGGGGYRLAGEHLHGAPPAAVDLVIHHVLQPLVVRRP